MTLFTKISWKIGSFVNPHKKELTECVISEKAALYSPYRLANVTVGDGTYISPNGRISMATIGKYSSIGPDFQCGWGIHPLNGVSTCPMFYSAAKQNGRSLVAKSLFEERKQVTIGNDVFIGRNVIVLDGVTIGDGAVIGAGAIVSKDIPAYAIAVGNPIKVVKYRFEPDVIEKLMELKWWDKNESVLKMIAKYNFDIDSFLKEMEKITGKEADVLPGA